MPADCGPGVVRPIYQFHICQQHQGTNTVNDNPHLMAIIDSKMAQARLNQQHGSVVRANDLLAQVKIYADALQIDPTPVRH
jgi:hypothetical protein